MSEPQSTTTTSADGSFVHLHVHTAFSLLQGAIQLDTLFERVKAMGMPAVAMTDTNNLFGAIEFYTGAKEAGLKPIIGCEILYAPSGKNPMGASGQPQGAAIPKHHHLTLLCKDLAGYRNLCQIVTQAYLGLPPPDSKEAKHAQALVTPELLEKYGEGLVVLSGCLRGEIAYKIVTGDEEGALKSVLWLKKRFGDDFYLELQDTGLPEQDHVNTVLYDWGTRHGIQTVATADCHYADPHDCEAHEVFQCIAHGMELDLERPKSLAPPEYFLKPAQLMRERFERFPGAADNTLKIADKCNVEFKFKDEKGRQIYHLPLYRPEGVAKNDPFDLLAYFRDLSRKGLLERYEEPGFLKKRAKPEWATLEAQYTERLESELSMIEKTGFAGYFLIVADFIQWAKKQQIPVGPGRGSGAGSLVAYCLKITDIDPIEFKLLFERFINPERVSMPDFDVDFCQDRRGEVIDYVSRKYGSDKVCQIITYGKLAAKAAVKDVARVFGFSFAESNAITALIPGVPGMTLDAAYEQEPRLRELLEQSERSRKIWEYSRKVEGLTRGTGVHAAGIIITEEPLLDYCPLYVTKDGALCTQFDKDSAEKIGLVKYDFLGLKTLTVIDNACKHIRKVARDDDAAGFALEKIEYDDPKVFELISSGATNGIFQVESDGMKDLCSRIQPGNLEDITAINALYRPGPLGSGMVDTFIDCKHGRQTVEYPVPQLEPILRDTYGVILYQEQVMQCARDLAGYSLGQADMLRRAMGKKKPEEMAKQREIFLKGASERGIPELTVQRAGEIFDLMAKFAEYGFNKSHSAAYGVLTYQTAYLKKYYAAEFMAALMTTEMSDIDSLTKYINDARDSGIPVLPPDVNHSERLFSVEWISPDSPDYPAGRKDKQPIKAIRFGLEAIKGVGGSAVEELMTARAAGSEFKGVMDFCRRVSTRKANKKVLESLIIAGAFDRVAEANRPSLLASLEGLLDVAGDEQEERELGQDSLFDAFGSDTVKQVTPANQVFKQEPDWPISKKLIEEKRVVGFYVSGHPMDSWQKICEDWLGWSTERIRKYAEEKLATQAAAPAKPQQQQGGYGGEGGGGGYNRYERPKRPEVKFGCLVSEMDERMTKTGKLMAIGEVEDLKGRIKVLAFSDAYIAGKEILQRAKAEAEPIIIYGELQVKEEGPEIIINRVEILADAHKGRAQQITLRLRADEITPDQLRELKRSLLEHRGKCPVRIDFVSPSFSTRLQLPKTVGVAPTPELVKAVHRIFGSSDVIMLQ